MDEKVGIELDADGGAPSRSQAPNVRKNISLKLKGKVRGSHARQRKTSSTSSSSSKRRSQTPAAPTEEPTPNEENQAPKFSMEEDISKLEAPKFSTIDRGTPEPLHHNAKLKWDYKVNLIGEKVVCPMIHCCRKCWLPILVYGRMIPCKHVFCYDCAKKTDKSCPRCNDKVQRVEQTGLGTVFMCAYGGSRHGNDGCCRTYLSQRDLHAHINHRHVRNPSTAATVTVSVPSQATPAAKDILAAPKHVQPAQNIQHSGSEYDSSVASSNELQSDQQHRLSHMQMASHLNMKGTPSQNLGHGHPHIHPGAHLSGAEGAPNPYGLDTSGGMHLHRAVTAGAVNPVPGQPPRSAVLQPHAAYLQSQSVSPSQPPLNYGGPSMIPVMSTRTNLITVPIQDESSSGGGVVGTDYRTTRPPPPHHPGGAAMTPPQPPSQLLPHHQQPPGIAYPNASAAAAAAVAAANAGHPPPPQGMYPHPHQHPHGHPSVGMPRPPPISYANQVSYAAPLSTQAFIQHHQVSHYPGQPQPHMHPHRLPNPSPGSVSGAGGSVGTGSGPGPAPPSMYNTPPPPPPPGHHHHNLPPNAAAAAAAAYASAQRHYGAGLAPQQPPPQQQGYGHSLSGWVGGGPGQIAPPIGGPHPPPHPLGQGSGPGMGHTRPPMYH